MLLLLNGECRKKNAMSHFKFGPSHKYGTFVQEVEKSEGIKAFQLVKQEE